ncbi:hypothetical protein ACHQM5_021609 [Ranunculus cassubicifolius]
MSSEMVHFRLSQFSDALKSSLNAQNQLPFRNLFEEIKVELEKKAVSSVFNQRDTPMDCLYKLSDAFTECKILMESCRWRVIRTYTPKEYIFLAKIYFRLRKIKRTVVGIPDASTSTASEDTVRKIQRQTSEVPDAITTYGLEVHMEEIVKSLQLESNDGFTEIGIVGMAGSGKTALAQLVINDERLQKVFNPRIWVPLSITLENTPNTSSSNIVEYILQELGDEYDSASDTSLESRLQTLYKQLMGKKYLIVLDDVWHISSWYENLGASKLNGGRESHNCLGSGLPKDYGGGVIVTSRLEQVAEKMVGESNLHRLFPVLNSTNCWSIFKEILVKKGIRLDHPDLAEMKDEIMEKCGGLPLGAKTLGEIVSNKLHERRIESTELEPIQIS